MPKLDLDAIPATNDSSYPEHLQQHFKGRSYRRLGPVTGLVDFGACQTILEPGAWSSHRHWHDGEDELIVVLSGHAVLVDDHGETLMAPGDIATFPKGEANGHVMQNRSDETCVFLAIGGPTVSDCHYPDVDMHFDAGRGVMHRKDGTDFTD